MLRCLIVFLIAITAPVQAGDSPWPNKPGKKPKAPVIVGAQSGLAAPAPADVTIGAGANLPRTGGGDYGFIAPQQTPAHTPRRAVGYDPARRLGNKAPTS